MLTFSVFPNVLKRARTCQLHIVSWLVFANLKISIIMRNVYCDTYGPDDMLEKILTDKLNI